MTDDTPPQPGWWQASDGQWYPPQQPQQPPAPAPAPPDATQQIPRVDQPHQATPPAQAPGPGWWQASDGQWYPPQQPAPPPAPTGSSKLPWIIGAVVALVAIGGVIAFAASSGGDDDDEARGDDGVVSTDTGGTTTDGGGDETTSDGGTDDTTSDGDTGGLGDDGGADTTDDGLDVGVVDDGLGDDGVFADDSASDDGTTDLPEGDVVVIGNDGEPQNNVAIAAIVDIEAWWAEIMPDVYGIDYEPVSGGFFAASPGEPLPPCAQSSDDVAFNAYYCSDGDVIAWDDTELFPQFLASSGPLAIGVIMAHEFGHAIQARVDMRGFTVTLEHQADCFAGAWVAKLQGEGDEVFEVSERTLDAALAAFLQLGDSPGSAATDPSAHGNAFDRINGFQIGLERGPDECATFTDDNITITELPFNDEIDEINEGNLDIAESLELFPADLDAFWAEVYPELVGEPWVSLQGGFVPFDADADALTCGGTPVDLLLFYCIDDDYVALDIPTVTQTLHNDIGDFAVASLVASQYGLAVQQRAGVGRHVRLNNLQADCLAGVWAGSIFPLSERVVDERAIIILSPGDFDEAVGALLFVGADPATHGTGFERVTAFRTGVFDGLEGCFAYDPPA